ncbi:MAG: sulfurtransferase complex subunit TusD [Pseudomonadota bacterium]
MIYSLVVLAGPATDVPRRALRFAQALLSRGHSLRRVFFLDDGVQCGLATAVPAQDELNQLDEWRKLTHKTQTELVVCISSALRRGVLDGPEAERHERLATTLDAAFSIGGLGLLVEAATDSERLITFGGRR